MKANLNMTLALAALLAGTSGAAQATEGWYGRADVGYSFDGQVQYGDDAEMDDDWLGALGAGYAFQNGFRLEG